MHQFKVQQQRYNKTCYDENRQGILEKKKDKVKMLLQIHDELIFECLKKMKVKLKRSLKKP